MSAFGDFLYELRKEKGMTQAELAEALGVTNKAVSKWETGEAMPETSLLLPISRIFGVTVDELLAGKRNEDRIEDEEFNISKHLFTRGKDETRLEKICGAICASVVLLGVTAYLILGAVFNLWNNYWVLIPVCALFSGIIGIVFDLFNPKKRRQRAERGENPYTGSACGIIILTCIIVYLCLGAFLKLWHPYWIMIPIGAVVCGILGALGHISKSK